MGPNMPVSVACDSAISTAIRDSLSTTAGSSSFNNTLNNQVVASVKRVLLQKIEYEEAPLNFGNSVHDELKTKYTFFNGGASPVMKDVGPNSVPGSTQSNKEVAHIPASKRILFPRENVQIGWKTSHKWQVGAGMMNVGNTCYLNSTLQALFHVPSLANWLLSDEDHRERCEELSGSQGGCIICAMSKTLISSQKSQQPIKPWLVYSKLRIVCKHLVPGHQEDAHEFLRYLMEAMEKAYLLRFKNSKEFDQYTKETTPVNQILGGYLKSSVRCLTCNHNSVTFQHFEDLLLDIRKANTVEEALDVHFARERLEDMGYKCEACKKKVSATKQFSLERPPVALCIQLKRFSMMGGKLNKHVSIRPKLDLSPYLSVKPTEPLSYSLVAMVTHLGASQHCGHYTAIGLTDAGGYYHFDDSCVRPISLQNVLNTNAYIMFYELEDGTSKQTSTITSIPATLLMIEAKENRMNTGFGDALLNIGNKSETSTRFIGPVLPSQKSLLLTNNINNNKSTNSIVESTQSNNTSKLGIYCNNNNNHNNLGSKLVNSPTKVINGHNSSKLVHQNGTLLSPDKNLPAENKNIIRMKTNSKKDDVNTNNNFVRLNGHSISETITKKTPTTINYEQNSSVHLTLPSMPKLDSPGTPSPNTTTSKLTFNSNDTFSKSNGFVRITNGHTQKPKSLVPYTSDDDSDSVNNNNHSENECPAPPIIKTKAGVWQVTSTNNMFNSSESNGYSTGSSKQFNKYNRNYTSSPENVIKMKKLGYGVPVESWNLEKKVSHSDKTEDRKRMHDDDDMDRGRQKKMKHHKNNSRDTPGYNPFQEHQNNRNRWNGGGVRYYNNYLYRQNPHNNSYNNYRGRHRGSGHHSSYHHQRDHAFNRRNTS